MSTTRSAAGPGFNWVRTRRAGAGLTQAQLGAVVGVSRQSIVSTEKGDYAPSVYLALRLAQALGTSVEDLFPLTEEVEQ
jgi:putative transcriptional regulator